jgi:gamma-glutamylaminecyclotransferase
MTPLKKLLFVYGTLKRGCSNHHFLTDQHFIAEARTIPGYTLYQLGGHPGMVAKADAPDGVNGEIWSVDEAALVRLDGLEGIEQGIYRRDVVPLLPPFSDLGIEGYIYNRSVKNRRNLGGQWTE